MNYDAESSECLIQEQAPRLQGLGKRIIFASAITLIMTVVSLLLGLGVQLVVARSFGPEGLGVYTATIMLVSFFALFAMSGFPATTSRYVAEYEEKGQHDRLGVFFSSAVFLSLVGAVIMAVISWFWVPTAARWLGLGQVSSLRLAVVLGVPCFVLMNMTIAYFQGLLEAFKASGICIVSSLVILILIVFGRSMQYDNIGMFVISGYGAAAFTGAILCFRHDVIRPVISGVELCAVRSFMWAASLLSITSFFSLWASRSIIGITLDVKQMGLFTAAMIVPQGIRMLSASIVPVLTPSYSKLGVHGVDSLSKVFNLNLRFATTIFTLGCGLAYLYAEAIMALFGAEFSAATPIMRLLLVGCMFSSVTIPTSSLITGAGFPKYSLYISLVALPVLVGLTCWMTIRYGPIGAAWASLVVGLIYVVGTLYVVVRVIEIRVQWRNLLLPLIPFSALVLSGMVIRLLFNISVLFVPVLVAIHFLVTYFAVLEYDDRERLLQLKKRLFV